MCIRDRKNLEKRGYTKEQISKAVTELVSKASNQVDSLYQINKEVYSLLRYGKQGVKDENKNRQTVHYIDWNNVENNDFYAAEEVSVLCFNQIAVSYTHLDVYKRQCQFDIIFL